MMVVRNQHCVARNYDVLAKVGKCRVREGDRVLREGSPPCVASNTHKAIEEDRVGEDLSPEVHY